MKALSVIFAMTFIFTLSCSTENSSELSHYKVVEYKGQKWEFQGCRSSASECKNSFPNQGKRSAYIVAKELCENDGAHRTEVIACLTRNK
jgi:hypothetical protein